MKKIIISLLTLFAIIPCMASSYVRIPTGISFHTPQGFLRLDFVTADIVRLRYTQETALQGNNTGVCVPRTERHVPFTLRQQNHELTATSDSLIVRVDLNTYAVSYLDAKTGKLLLRETDHPRNGKKVAVENIIYDEHSKRMVETADGKKEMKDELKRDTIGYVWQMSNHFVFQPGEAVYGLGAHMEGYLNLRNKTQYLCQHNLKEMVPVLNSTKGYGLLFDAGCAMLYTERNGDAMVELEAVKEIDYYFIKGHDMDRVVAQYRLLTGQTPLLPRYMFGYIQSKERFHSSKEIIETLQKYRDTHVPVDVMVQDWNYWPQGWGYIKMDPRYYPSVQNLTDSVHALNGHLMVSIWPNPTDNPEADDFKARGMMLKHSDYDAFNPLARKHYWSYVDDTFFSKGMDAWWCDCSEPLDADWNKTPANYHWGDHKRRWEMNTALLSDELGPERASLYSLYHAKGIYENQRLTTAEKRVVNLTRSSYAGQQRYSTITWNGDTYASWESFARMIPSGLNFTATGCNYYTVDIGCFFVNANKGNKWFAQGVFHDGANDMGYREFYARMFQYGTFLPIQRSHGTDTPREIWNFGKPGEPFYDVILKMIHLRYQLLPYNYSMADAVSNRGYTMMRMLAFDYPDDSRVLDLKDEYMYGPALLVCPVTQPFYYGPGSTPLQVEKKQRTVYLPKGDRWVDFWTDL